MSEAQGLTRPLCMRHLGNRKHVAYPCDEQDPASLWRRTWDVYRNSSCVAAGFATRAQARRAAQRLDDNRKRWCPVQGSPCPHEDTCADACALSGLPVES